MSHCGLLFTRRSYAIVNQDFESMYVGSAIIGNSEWQHFTTCLIGNVTVYE